MFDFLELTETNGLKILINIADISSLSCDKSDSVIICFTNNAPVGVKEKYNDIIKSLGESSWIHKVITESEVKNG